MDTFQRSSSKNTFTCKDGRATEGQTLHRSSHQRYSTDDTPHVPPDGLPIPSGAIPIRRSSSTSSISHSNTASKTASSNAHRENTNEASLQSQQLAPAGEKFTAMRGAELGSYGADYEKIDKSHRWHGVYFMKTEFGTLSFRLSVIVPWLPRFSPRRLCPYIRLWVMLILPQWPSPCFYTCRY